MSDEIILYTNPQSRSRIVHWMLAEVGVPCRAEVLAYGPEMKSEAYLRLNPMGKVPTLVHRGQVVTEVAAICAYLADAFPEAGLAPAPADRAAYYRWLFFAAGPLEQAVTNAALKVEVSKEQSGFVGYGDSLERVLDTLETALTGPFVAGDRFSAADVYVGAHIGWGMQFKTIPARPAFVAYWDRLKDRPAARRGLAGDGAEGAE